MSLVMFQIDGDEKAITKILKKYYGNSLEKDEDGALYVNCRLAPDYCQLIGLSNRDTKDLEKIAKLLSKGGKKIDSFNKKKMQLQKKLNEAKNEASSGQEFNMSGMGISNINELVSGLDQHMEEVQKNEKVQKAQQKLDKFVNKKKLMDDAQHYTVSGVGKGMISFGEGLDVQSNNIFSLIDKVQSSDSEFIDSSFKSFTSMVKELMGYSSEIGVMAILDGEKKSHANNSKTVKLNDLKAKDLANADNRELYIIKSK